MERLERDTIVLRLVEELKSRGSWAGETHVQKSTYFLEGLLGVPLGFTFLLYKHGPFSFDLRDELAAMRVQDFLAWELQQPGYGPSLAPSDKSSLLKRQFQRIAEQYKQQIEFVAERLASKNVAELERLATALYVTLEECYQAERAAIRINQLKPHITITEAEAAVQEVDSITRDAQRLAAEHAVHA